MTVKATGTGLKVAHVTTVDSSLWYLLRPQLLGVIADGGEVIGISAPGPHVGPLEADGVRHMALLSSTRGWDLCADVRSALELWRIVRAEHPDVLHTHNPKPGVYGRIVGRLAGVPVVVNTNHGLWIGNGGRARRAAVLAMEGVAARFSDVELIQNPEDLELLVSRRLTSPRRTRLLGNGVALDRFRPAADDDERAASRALLGAGPDQIVVGCVGRLVAEKGYLELVAAAERLDDRYVVVVVGPEDPAKPDALTADQQAAGRAAGVRFVGHRDDVDVLYRGMDLFVLASHREGFPRAAMEAAASGLATIATDIRGCRQVVADGITGLLVPVRDADRLADAIRRLGDDPATRRAMGAAASTRARAEFDERRIVGAVLEAYRARPTRRRWLHPVRSRRRRSGGG